MTQKLQELFVKILIKLQGSCQYFREFVSKNFVLLITW